MKYIDNKYIDNMVEHKNYNTAEHKHYNINEIYR